MKRGVEFEWTKRNLENALTDGELYRRVCGEETGDGGDIVGEFSELKERAALGDKEARSIIAEYFKKVLEVSSGGNMDRIIAGLVDFEDPLNNSPRVMFEMLTDNESLGKILDEYGGESVFDEEMLRKAVTDLRKGIADKFDSPDRRLLFIATYMYEYIYGQDCIDSLQFQDINEIGMLRKDYIYGIRRGRKIFIPFLKMSDTGVIINIQKKTTRNSAMNFDRQNPILVTAKNNSSRISVAAFDVTPFDEDVYYNERIFNLNVITLEEMRDVYNTVDDNIYRFLSYNQRGRGSFIVTGADMGVGKSTFLLAMLGKCPDYWGIGVLDAQNELQIGRKYPKKNVITLVENDKKSLTQCFAYLLKTSRDIIVVGEITLPEEVAELMNASMRLNAGVCGTMHSQSPEEVIPNLRNLMLRTDMYKTENTAEDDAAGAIDLIIHLRRLDKGRIVAESIDEVCVPGKERRYGLNRLFAFDGESSAWKVCEGPSERYFNKMSRYLPSEDTAKIRKLFEDGRSTENEHL